jgi:hypothetical protein
MLSVGDKGGTAETLTSVQSNACGQFVAHEPNQASSSKRPQMRKLLGM